MPSLIPPVGNRIRLELSGANRYAQRPDVRLYASGTAALADALQWARRSRGSSEGEVLIPAYGCPALVAAALHAGLTPVLVDLAVDSPFPDAAAISEYTTQRTIACLHVNFMGLPPPLPALRSGDATGADLRHIYDCCQGWPAGGNCPPWADAAVVSFGRGKPITLGTGGAVFFSAGAAADVPPQAPVDLRGAASFALRSRLYNLVLSPPLYWWIDRMPGLHIGETNYEPLTAVLGMCSQALRYLDQNIVRYEGQQGWSVAKVLATVGAGPFGAFRFLEQMHTAAGGERLLRLPLLAESKQARDRAVVELRKMGYSATAMYRAPLWTFRGLESLQPYAERCQNAARFADRLLTLPVHAGVAARELHHMTNLLQHL